MLSGFSFVFFFFALDSDISLSNIYPFHSSPLSSLVQALFIFFVLPSLILVLLLKLNYLLFILHALNTNSLLLLPSLKTFNELRNNPSPLLIRNNVTEVSPSILWHLQTLQPCIP